MKYEVDKGAWGCAYVEAEGLYVKYLYLFIFFYKPKTALKYKVLKKRRH